METTKDTKTKNRFPNKSSEQRIAIQYQHKASGNNHQRRTFNEFLEYFCLKTVSFFV